MLPSKSKSESGTRNDNPWLQILHANALNICKQLQLQSEGVHTGRERLIRSHSSARFSLELSGNSN